MKQRKLKITLVTDNPKSWIIPYVRELRQLLAKQHRVVWVTRHEQIQRGDLAFFLSCEKIIKPETLFLHKHNLVVHPSRLPKGRGWSPLAWQILEGKNEISITLFEAAPRVDSGRIYFQDRLFYEGHELAEELKRKQGDKTVALVLKFVNRYPHIKGRAQKGRPSYYPRRTPESCELHIGKNLKSQFNLLRIADNQRYPAFFKYRGHKYILSISKA